MSAPNNPQVTLRVVAPPASRAQRGQRVLDPVGSGAPGPRGPLPQSRPTHLGTGAARPLPDPAAFSSCCASAAPPRAPRGPAHPRPPTPGSSPVCAQAPGSVPRSSIHHWSLRPGHRLPGSSRPSRLVEKPGRHSHCRGLPATLTHCTNKPRPSADPSCLCLSVPILKALVAPGRHRAPNSSHSHQLTFLQLRGLPWRAEEGPCSAWAQHSGTNNWQEGGGVREGQEEPKEKQHGKKTSEINLNN